MNKTALIFGGCGGIGYAISNYLANCGLKIYASYHKSKCLVQNKNIKLIKCDIARRKDVKNLIDAIIKDQKNIDIVINAVSPLLKLKLFENLTKEDFKIDIETILNGAINIFKETIPIMKIQKSGLIINFITSAINDPVPQRMSSYVAAKSGLLGLTKCLAAETAKHNIKIIAISPSYVETGLLNAFPNKLLEIERAKTKENKFLEPKNIAKLIFEIIKKLKIYKSGSNIIINTQEDINKFLN